MEEDRYRPSVAYQPLEGKRSRKVVRVILPLLILPAAFLLGYSILGAREPVRQNVVVNVFMVDVEWSLQEFHTTSTKFLSFGLDTSLLRDMKNLPISNETFVNLARHLAPAYVRIGGTSADCLYFDEPARSRGIVYSPVDGQDISNFTITHENFEDLYKFAKKAGLSMIFDLNVLRRSPDNSWDDENARKIIQFASKKNMTLDWQLGNEPNSFRHVFGVTISPVQLADDYYRLRKLLNETNYENSILVGPEVNHVGDHDKGELYAKTFLENDRDSVKYVTWHQYYLNGREAQVENFTDPSVFNMLSQQIDSMYKFISESGKEVPMWLCTFFQLFKVSL